MSYYNASKIAHHSESFVSKTELKFSKLKQFQVQFIA